MSPWKPGESGNPTGRPKQFSEVQRLARDMSTESLEKG
ncbi:MAG: DUF5681 domain-containing protein [Myxococcaceae bacterium]